MNKELYLFNPFEIKKKTELELKDIYEAVYNELIEESKVCTMYEYAHNIEVYSNLNYISGEIIARLQKDVIELKTKIKIDTALVQVEERQKYIHEIDKKAPAMSYFEALATRFSKDDISKLADKECSLTRFKNAYKSVEEKINALKKKMESIKYEEFND